MFYKRLLEQVNKPKSRQKLKDGDDEMLLGVIREIREQILNFLAPNSGTRDRIKAQLDMELIQQEWVNGTLDFKVCSLSDDKI